jgi:hypothetical protein
MILQILNHYFVLTESHGRPQNFPLRRVQCQAAREEQAQPRLRGDTELL